jgi:hypothetical protein
VLSTTNGGMELRMFIRIFSSMGGTVGERGFVFEPASIIDYSHDPIEARRIVDRGRAEELSDLAVAQLKATGVRVHLHPLAAAKRK